MTTIIREITCPNEISDRPRIQRHSDFGWTENNRSHKRKKAWRCWYCKKKLIWVSKEDGTLTHDQAMASGHPVSNVRGMPERIGAS